MKFDKSKVVSSFVDETSVEENREEFTEADKKEIIDDLREAFRELKLIRQGKLKTQTWEEFFIYDKS